MKQKQINLYKWNELRKEAQEKLIEIERKERMRNATRDYFEPLIEEVINTWGKKAGFNINVSDVLYDISGAPNTGVSFVTNGDIDILKTLEVARLVFPDCNGVIDYIKENKQFDYVVKNYRFNITRDHSESTMYAVSCKLSTDIDDSNDDEDTRWDRTDVAEDLEAFGSKVKNYICEIIFNKISESFWYLISDESIIQMLEDKEFTSDGKMV